MLPPQSLAQTIDKTVREEWGRILASLVKTLGDLQLAEDCLQDAITTALTNWQTNGLPRSPAAWLITTARRKAIDRLRHDKTARTKHEALGYLADLENTYSDDMTPEFIPDKRLEMIFTCCHPALEEKTRVALTLRTLGGLTTDEIARTFLDAPDAMAQRLVRAKKKIALAGIPYQIPQPEALPARIASVLSVIYLIFNAGYSAPEGRTNLTDEAIRLARIIRQLLPNEAEVAGLLALMLLHDSRRYARTNNVGEMVPLDAQNRARWDRAKIHEGIDILQHTLPKQRPKQQVGTYQLQAAISAVHAQSNDWDSTDWPQICALYQLLFAVQPSPVVQINLAIAVSYAHSLTDALTLLNTASANGALDNYQPFYAAKADILMRSGDNAAAKRCYAKAIALSQNPSEIAFLTQKSADRG